MRTREEMARDIVGARMALATLRGAAEVVVRAMGSETIPAETKATVAATVLGKALEMAAKECPK